MSILLSDRYRERAAAMQARRERLCALEEELNRRFIDLYRLDDTLSPAVRQKDLIAPEPELARELASLMSYFLGCAFGRYSLDREGLIFAGGDFFQSYQQKGNRAFLSPSDPFGAVAENLILLRGLPDHPNDLIRLLEEFLTAAYGADTLEENFLFLSEGLTGGADSPRESLREYFCTAFFQYHYKMYKNLPLYIPLTFRGKDSFGAVFYLHRYQPEDALLFDRTFSAWAQTHPGEQKGRLLLEERLRSLAERRPSIDLEEGIRVSVSRLLGEDFL